MAPAAEIAQRALRRVHRLRKLRSACVDRPRRRTVHKLRTESRRLLADLDLVAFAVPPGSLATGRNTLRKLLKATAALRDIHVHLRMAKRLLRELPEAESLRRHLRRGRSECEKRAVRKLSREKLRHALAHLPRAFQAAGRNRDEGVDALRRVLAQSYRRCVELRRAARTSAGLHRLRVALKQYSHLASVLRPYLPGLEAGQLESLDHLRAKLGAAHDLASFEVAVRNWRDDLRVVLVPVSRRRQILELQCRREAARLIR